MAALRALRWFCCSLPRKPAHHPGNPTLTRARLASSCHQVVSWLKSYQGEGPWEGTGWEPRGGSWCPGTDTRAGSMRKEAAIEDDGEEAYGSRA
jgi:hypothetical protein